MKMFLVNYKDTCGATKFWRIKASSIESAEEDAQLKCMDNGWELGEVERDKAWEEQELTDRAVAILERLGIKGDNGSFIEGEFDDRNGKVCIHAESSWIKYSVNIKRGRPTYVYKWATIIDRGVIKYKFVKSLDLSKVKDYFDYCDQNQIEY